MDLTIYGIVLASIAYIFAGGMVCGIGKPERLIFVILITLFWPVVAIHAAGIFVGTIVGTLLSGQ